MKRAPYIAFALLGLIWGSNFIFMKWAVRDISPSQIVLLRVVFGFVPICVAAIARRALRWEHVRHTHHFAVMSILATAAYYWAFAKGTALLPSSIAGLLSGAIPLFTFICAWLFLKAEYINAAKAGGVALGLLGVLLIARPWSHSGAISMLGVAYVLAGSLSLGCSFVYARNFITPLQIPALALTTYQIGVAMLLLLITTRLNGIGAVFSDVRAWTGLVLGLGLCGTGFAYVIYYYIVEQLGAVAAASVTYVPPVVALVIGVLLAGDIVHPLTYFAPLLILSGVAALQFGGRHASARER